MKKYPSYTSINNLNLNNNGKKISLMTKYEKVNNNTKSAVRNPLIQNIYLNSKQNLYLEKQSISNFSSKKGIELAKKQSVVEKIKTQANQNKDVSDKQDYQALKSRLFALQDRLVQIKKSYEMRKNKSQHFSIQKGSNSKFQLNKQNQKCQKTSAIHKKQICIDVKPLIIQNKQLQNRLPVQSPKAESANQKKIVQQIKNQEVNNTPNSQAILSEYVTQYEQKPVSFRHTTSQTNLLRPVGQQKLNDLKKQNKNAQVYYVSSLIRAMESEKPSSFDQLCAGHLLASYQFLCYVKNAGIQKPNKPVIKNLPPPTKKHTVIFDLDETLIHCLDSKKVSQADIMIPVLFPDKNKVTVGINIRPYTKECLKQLSKYFQIMVFTASHANYASAVVEHLDPQKQYISYKFSRQSCYKTQQGFYVKDLRVVDRKPSNILLIDNAAYSYCFQPENGVPIVPYYDNKADLQLKNLIPYLKSFLNQSDVRIRNSQIMKLAQYTKYKGPQDLLNKLYK